MTKRNAPCIVVDDLPFKAPAGHTQYHREAPFLGAPGKVIALTFGCPCGCGAHHGGRFSGPGAWGFDGNEAAPTVAGSFGCYGEPVGPDGKYHWHGHLVRGVFEEC